MSEGFFVDADFIEAFRKKGLTSIDAVFNFSGGEKLTKSNLAKHRSRIQFDLDESGVTLFLKRYEKPVLDDRR